MPEPIAPLSRDPAKAAQLEREWRARFGLTYEEIMERKEEVHEQEDDESPGEER